MCGLSAGSDSGRRPRRLAPSGAASGVPGTTSRPRLYLSGRATASDGLSPCSYCLARQQPTTAHLLASDAEEERPWAFSPWVRRRRMTRTRVRGGGVAAVAVGKAYSVVQVTRAGPTTGMAESATTGDHTWRPVSCTHRSRTNMLRGPAAHGAGILPNRRAPNSSTDGQHAPTRLVELLDFVDLARAGDLQRVAERPHRPGPC